MLGNPKWFKQRKYTGWGLTPTTWQGWVYIGGFLSAIGTITAAMAWWGAEVKTQLSVCLSLIIVFVIDCIDIFLRLKKDERETFHEALAERNTAWIMATILVFGLVYESVAHARVNPFIVAALLGGTVVKGISNWYLLDK